MLEHSLIEGTSRGGTTEQEKYIQEVLRDYRICRISREVSLLGRREVLTGKAKFGVFGDGKEVPQVALARAFKKGDHRSGYYRDQTLMFALGISSVEEYFAQLYADTYNDPFSGGRQMNTHFATPYMDEEGEWIDHKKNYNVSSDVSCTAGQMARSVGLALASKKYRELAGVIGENKFSDNGREVCFVTIGDASTSEGAFWEAINAAGVMRIPMAVSVWDDGYGISVPSKYQTTKQSISEVLEGFKPNEEGEGLDIYVGKGWDYPGLCNLYEKGIAKVRKTHIPAVFHIAELTQPQGHSTSGSHERYKSKERLEWEKKYDCIVQMRQWMIDAGLATEEELTSIDREARSYVRACKNRAWKAFTAPVKVKMEELRMLYQALIPQSQHKSLIHQQLNELQRIIDPVWSDLVKNARHLLYELGPEVLGIGKELKRWVVRNLTEAKAGYETHLYSDTEKSALEVPVIPPSYSDNSPTLNGYQVINTFFDIAFASNPYLLAFGEDVGAIGDVNQGFAGLQKKYGETRIFDTGIREWTIVGQGIGLAMRGFRPIAEIQYLDYLVYGLTPLTDDLATLRWRSNGQQKSPALIRTRGHRFEGIWHAGSPMGMLIHSLRGIYILVPRNMTQAAGFYNTMLQSDDPAIIIECLNGYRRKEILPDNIGEYTVPLGVPEVLRGGTDITLVTYGACVQEALEGIDLLAKAGIFVELIDVQSLLPFDLEHRIVESLKKTNRIVFMDEDLPGGATAYMMQEVLENQNGYRYLDASPITITATEHRTPYASTGSYFSKPVAGDVFDSLYGIMHESDPQSFPLS